MSTASAHIEAMRCYLKMPTRDESLWRHLDKNQRRALLMMSGLPIQWFDRKWYSMTQIERMKIITQVHEASTWTAKLKGPE